MSKADASNNGLPWFMEGPIELAGFGGDQGAQQAAAISGISLEDSHLHHFDTGKVEENFAATKIEYQHTEESI